MRVVDRGTLYLAVLLIAIGVIVLGLNLIPGAGPAQTWPVILFVIAIAFFLPAFLWPVSRRGLAGMAIPGSILAVLAAILAYDTLTGDWSSWGYMWILIVASVGLGLILAASIGGWGRGTIVVGLWIAVSSLVVFSIFAGIFGGPVLRAIGPVLLIVVGVGFLARSFRR